MIYKPEEVSLHNFFCFIVSSDLAVDSKAKLRPQAAARAQWSWCPGFIGGG